MTTSARCWDFGRPSVGADDPAARTPVHRKKDGFPRRPVGPPRNDQDCHCEERSDAAIRIPRPLRLPCAKGTVSRRLTEGLSGVAGPFWGNPCSDSHPFPRTRWRKRSAVRRYPGQSRRLSATTRRARRPGVPSLVPPRGVGADAHIGPLLRTTCVAPVGRGDLTPPSWTHRPAPVPRRGRAPSRPAGERLRFTLISVGSQTPLVPRRGGPMCPPADASREEPCPGRHIGRPLQNLHQPRKTGRGQSPAPTGWIPNRRPVSMTPAARSGGDLLPFDSTKG